jgi:hypothetical protein
MKLQLRDPEKRAQRGKPLANLFTKDGGYTLYEHGISQIGRRGEFIAFGDHHIDIRCETAGEIHSRFTATRIVLLGVFALAFKKHKDGRAAFVTVTVDYEPRWISEVAPDKTGKALEFAKKVERQRAAG